MGHNYSKGIQISYKNTSFINEKLFSVKKNINNNMLEISLSNVNEICVLIVSLSKIS